MGDIVWVGGFCEVHLYEGIPNLFFLEVPKELVIHFCKDSSAHCSQTSLEINWINTEDG